MNWLHRLPMQSTSSPVQAHCSRATHGLLVGVTCVIGLLLWTATLLPASGQTLIDRYQQERQQHVLQQLFSEGVWDASAPGAYRPLPAGTDTLYQKASTYADDGAELFSVDNVRVVHRFEETWFNDTFADVNWSFLGPQHQRALLDTTRTVDLRARMQAHFGAPTHVLADDLTPERERFDQFAYWLVVNDSIPVIVTDASGARDRGLVLMTERRWRDALLDLRDAVLAPLHETDDRAPYVDYFYDDVDNRWYRVGFDGQTFFHEPIARRQLRPGVRPRPPEPAASP